MRGLNKVTRIGNLGKAPDIQVPDGNVPVARLSLATSETWRNKAGQRRPIPLLLPSRAGTTLRFASVADLPPFHFRAEDLPG